MNKVFYTQLNKAALLFTIIYIAIYYHVSIKYAVNFPVMDDIYSTTAFLDKYIKASSFVDQINMLFTPYNSHILFTHKLTFIISYYLFGVVDYAYISILGNILLLGIWFLFFFHFKAENKEENKHIFYFLPITLFLFTPAARITNWVGCSLQHASMLFYGFLALYFLFKESKTSLFWALIFLFLSMFSMVGGLAVPIAGFILLLFERKIKFQRLTIWSVISFCYYLIYFFFWAGIIESNNNESSLYNTILLFFAFLGNGLLPMHFYWNYVVPGFQRHIVTVLAGAMMFFWGIYSLDKKKLEKNRVLFAWILFTLGIGAAFAIGRIKFPYSYAGKPRFYWMEISFMVLFYMYVYSYYLKYFRKKNIAIIIIILYSGIITSYRYNRNIYVINRRTIESKIEVQTFRNVPKKGEKGFYHKKLVEILILRSLNKGYYKLPIEYQDNYDEDLVIDTSKDYKDSLPEILSLNNTQSIIIKNILHSYGDSLKVVKNLSEKNRLINKRQLKFKSILTPVQLAKQKYINARFFNVNPKNKTHPLIIQKQLNLSDAQILKYIEVMEIYKIILDEELTNKRLLNLLGEEKYEFVKL